MNFSFSNAASGGGSASSAAPTLRDGPALEEIQTDQLGFAAINGVAQLRVVPTPWPADALPPPSASLLAISAQKGLFAAAGPDGIYLASTDRMHTAFKEKTEGDNPVRNLDAQVHIPYPRPGHVTISADENILVASRQDEGGLDAFQLGALGEGQNSPALSISTNSQGLRALIPNPAVDSAFLFALITNNGELLLADLHKGSLRQGKDGNVLKSGVTCCSWSNKGKQLVAGGFDGTVTQMKPDGTVVAQIPKSTSIPAGCHVSGVSWLENDSFLVIYSQTNTDDGSESEYYIVIREPKTTNFTFQKFPEVVPAFGLERYPPYHFITRLRSFPPHIQDLLVMTSCCSTDISIISKADRALSSDDKVETFTLSSIGDDARRATLPMGQDNSDTTPIGMALDLSSTEKVLNPIPSDVELLETPGPVPGILVLTSEGHLLCWWLIYSDSVRQGTVYPGLDGVAAAASPDHGLSPPPMTQEPETANVSAPFSANAFGQSSISSDFSKPSLSNFGSANSGSALGSTLDGAFGQPSTIGGSKTSWTSTGFAGNTPSQTGGSGFGRSGFAQPSFGSSTPMGGSSGPAFGSASSLSGQAPGFGQPPAGPAAAFGKPAFGSGTTFGQPSASNTFGASSKAPESSGFASFSEGSGFGGGQSQQAASSPFGKASGDNVFGKQTQPSPFSAKTGGFGFGDANAASSKSPFGGARGFKLESSFKGDGSAMNDGPKPLDPGAGFGLSSLDDTLGEQSMPLSPTHDKEEEMGDHDGAASSEDEVPSRTPFGQPALQLQKEPPQNLVTPPATLSQSKATPAQPVSNLFGTSNQSTTPAAPPTSTGWSFGQLPSTTPKEPPSQRPSTTPKEPPAPVQKPLFGSDASQMPSLKPSTVEPPKIKAEPPSDDDTTDLSQIPAEAPLPPDPVSKPAFASGSVSSLNSKATESSPDDAPLPPDFLPANKSASKRADEEAPPSDREEGEIDESEFSSDFEGSAEDDEENVSPIEEPTDDHVQTSPESSAKSGEKSTETSPTGGLFTKVSTNATQKPARPLFGEVGTTGPIFAPPKPQESPRSPSPVRHVPPMQALKAESSRSVSAPAHPRSVIDKRKTEHAQSQMAIEAARTREEEIAKQQSRKQEEHRLSELAEAEELQRLEDNEDDRLRDELQAPVDATPELDDFVTYQPKAAEDGSKSGVPAQIERLYQDINSMVYTLGINARSLSAFMKYQTEQPPNRTWPQVLKSETPMDALNDEQVLDDTARLHEGSAVLEAMQGESQIQGVAGKLQDCHKMLSQDLIELRLKLAGIRKSLTLNSTADTSISAPLSVDQASIQNDLRKSSAVVQSKLGQVEDALAMIRAKLTELSPSEQGNRRSGVFGTSEGRKKPTVEAVSTTIAKMTAMAEKKSADIDVLEAQLRKLDMAHPSVNGVAAFNSTPNKANGQLPATTPKSGRSSIYHTPDSKFAGSTRSTPGRRASANGVAAVISAEDRERWQAKARRKKEVASILVKVLAEKREAPSSMR